MRYAKEADARAHGVNMEAANISATGSVRGMQARYGWKPGGQIRIGGYIYNLGVAEIQRLRAAGIVRGER